MKLSLIIPCYNEEGNVLPLYEKACSTFRDQLNSYEFVFVNDGSFDGTRDVLKRLVKEAAVPVKVVGFSRNFGKESAIYAGLHEAEGEYICIIDGDLQQSPELVLEMVKYLDSTPDCDCVTAFQEDRNENSTVAFLKNGFYKVINSVSDTNFKSGASDFRTFRRNVAETILSMSEYHRFSKGLFSWVGFNTHYIPYHADERLSGESKWNVIKLFKYAFDGIIAFSTAPLKVPTWIGLGTTVLGLSSGVVNSLRKSAGKDVENVDRLSSLIMTMGGLQLTAIGVAGEYLARTYVQVKKRPVYIVKDHWTNA